MLFRSLNITTLNYSIKALEVLDSYFKNFYFIPGNHDLYYRDRRDIASVAFADKFTNINLVSDHYSKDGVTLLPWMVNDEWKHVKKIKDPYVFGHLELPHFMMNAMVAMPEHGELRRENFTNFEHVFTGHFHKRQTQKNITYIGNCFPHNYADAGDDAVLQRVLVDRLAVLAEVAERVDRLVHTHAAAVHRPAFQRDTAESENPVRSVRGSTCPRRCASCSR